MKPAQNDHSTIRVSKQTKKRLENYGKFGESHDDLLCRILDYYENNRNQNRKRKRP